MKSHLMIASIVAAVLAVLFNMGRLFPMPKTQAAPSDAKALRAEALRSGLLPVPWRWEDAVRIVGTTGYVPTSGKIALGRRLFFDPLLSKDRSLSCASCHRLERGGDDDLPTAIGYRGQANPRHLNAPTVLNAALATRQFWDGRSPDVEAQVKGPILAPFEMAISVDEVVARLQADGNYTDSFKRVFPNRGITFDTVTEAIGAFERTLLTRGAYDRFLEGDDDAISEEAKKGLALFMHLGCKGCHGGMSVGGRGLQTFPLRRYDAPIVPHAVWVDGKRYFRGFSFAPLYKESPYPFADSGGFHGKSGAFRFRVPILRNITQTAPYFHNGSVERIEEALRIMGRHQLGLDLSKQQTVQLVAFLKTLDGHIVMYEIH